MRKGKKIEKEALGVKVAAEADGEAGLAVVEEAVEVEVTKEGNEVVVIIEKSQGFNGIKRSTVMGAAAAGCSVCGVVIARISMRQSTRGSCRQRGISPFWSRHG
jgi:hypothetical protein